MLHFNHKKSPKRKYQSQYTRVLSEITFIMYAQNRKIELQNDLSFWEQ